MSVLCEAISVIVPVDLLGRKYPGGAQAYAADCPDTTYCQDDKVTRVGFMHPDDTMAYINRLVRQATLTPQDGHQFVDLAVVDQFRGLTMPCPWLEWDQADGLTRAWLAGTDPGDLAVPPGWEGPSTVKWELDGAGRVRSRVSPGVDLDLRGDHFIATEADMEGTVADELRRIADPPADL